MNFSGNRLVCSNTGSRLYSIDYPSTPLCRASSTVDYRLGSSVVDCALTEVEGCCECSESVIVHYFAVDPENTTCASVLSPRAGTRDCHIPRNPEWHTATYWPEGSIKGGEKEERESARARKERVCGGKSEI
jgi:hypothetical protein